MGEGGALLGLAGDQQGRGRGGGGRSGDESGSQDLTSTEAKGQQGGQQMPGRAPPLCFSEKSQSCQDRGTEASGYGQELGQPL